jgi:hypothetical protein
MDIIYYLFAGAAGTALALGSLAIWAPRPTVVRIVAVVIVALFLPVLYLQMLEMLSRPKPMTFEWYKANAERAQLLGVSLSEGEAIYLWLMLDNAAEPRAYEVPWNLELAEKLEDSVDEAVRRGATIVLRKPFFRKSTEDLGHLNMQIVPPPLPPQKRPPMPPQIFNPRQQAI